MDPVSALSGAVSLAVAVSGLFSAVVSLRDFTHKIVNDRGIRGRQPLRLAVDHLDSLHKVAKDLNDEYAKSSRDSTSSSEFVKLQEFLEESQQAVSEIRKATKALDDISVSDASSKLRKRFHIGRTSDYDKLGIADLSLGFANALIGVSLLLFRKQSSDLGAKLQEKDSKLQEQESVCDDQNRDLVWKGRVIQELEAVSFGRES